jgi:hypothetical protein
MARVEGNIGQVDVSALILGGRGGISAAFVSAGRVDVFGLSWPAFVVSVVGFRQFMDVGKAAAYESVPSSVIAWIYTSPFKFSAIGDTIISATFGVGLGGDDWQLFPIAQVYSFAPSIIDIIDWCHFVAFRPGDVYTIFAGIRRVATFARFIVGPVRSFSQLDIGGVRTFAQLNIGGVAILTSSAANWDTSGEYEVLGREYD